MVVESFPKFAEWIGPGLGLFGLIILVAAILGIFVGYLIASFRHGPFEAFYVVAQVISQAIPDFLFTSPRRIWALARLAIKEALRRRVILVTFGIFATMLLFGGWFMNAGSDKPDQIYVNFVLWGTQLLVLLMGMLLSAFSLPEDIKNKTIYTVVTKPVRPTEIVLGRVIGFGLLGTGLLVLMGLISFLFVWRGLSHTHLIHSQGQNATQTLAAFEDIDQNTKLSRFSGRRVSDNAIKEAETSNVSDHKHVLELIEDIRDADAPPPSYLGNVVSQEPYSGNRIVYRRIFCNETNGHTHRITLEGEGEAAKISIGPAIGYFRARTPLYATKLQFYDRQGQPSKGINVGKEWGYRGFVDGGSSHLRSTLSKAEFDFDNIYESKFGDAKILPLDLTLGVFRTYKGDIEKRVTGGLQFHSIPDSNLDNVVVSEIMDFESNEYTIQTLPIPRKMVGKLISPDGKLIEEREFDLFDDFAKNGKFRLTLTCRDINQYLGVAPADVYLRTADQLYWVNFVKGYFGIWCQMMIIIAMGVAFSTFLSAPVTMLATMVMIIVGFFTTFIRTLMTSDSVGGGPIESLVRVITQKNMVTNLETGVATTIMEQSDLLLTAMLKAVTYLAPDFSKLNFADFLTYGYAIDNQRILVALSITIAFCLGLTILGYFALKTREIAK